MLELDDLLVGFVVGVEEDGLPAFKRGLGAVLDGVSSTSIFLAVVLQEGGEAFGKEEVDVVVVVI